MIEQFTFGMVFGAGAIVGAVIGIAICIGIVALVNFVTDMVIR